MKKDLRSSKQIIKALSIGISATMMLQPISAFADDTSAADNLHTTGTGRDAAITDSTVAQEVKAAEDADKAAYEAKEAAEKAEELVEKLVEEVAGKEATETEEAVDGILDKDNNGDELTLEENVEEAKEAVADANDAVDDLQAEVDAALDVIAEEATNDVSANVTATETAYNNADKAEDAARLALETLSGNDSIVYKEDAMVEVNKAIEAANTADEEAKKAETALTEAEERYNKAVEDYEALLAQADVSRNEIEKSVSDTEYADAQDELAKAKAAMEAAKAEYDAALAKVGTAENNAKEALKQAGIADENADKVIDYLEAIKKSGELATLQQNVADAEASLKSAKENEELVKAEQGAIIEARKAEKEAAEKLSEQYAGEMSTELTEKAKQQGRMDEALKTINNEELKNQANGGVKEYTYKLLIGVKVWGKVVGKWTEVSKDYYYNPPLGIKLLNREKTPKEYYSETEKLAAQNMISAANTTYNEAKDLRDAADRRYGVAKANKDTQDGNAKTAQDGIDAAENTIKLASDAVTTEETRLKNANSELNEIAAFIYVADSKDSREIDFNDKKDQELFKNLCDKMKDEYNKYNDVRIDYENYYDLNHANLKWYEIGKQLYNWYKECKIEHKYTKRMQMPQRRTIVYYTYCIISILGYNHISFYQQEATFPPIED
ncbi:MAG: hypothetical protein IJM28_06035 [Lachnospiraceae bacterium]|nr:hypothetical protein [Lachnospiraceae bacterium]